MTPKYNLKEVVEEVMSYTLEEIMEETYIIVPRSKQKYPPYRWWSELDYARYAELAKEKKAWMEYAKEDNWKRVKAELTPIVLEMEEIIRKYE